MSATERDRDRAEALAIDLPGLDYDDDGISWRRQVDAIAAALAAERERARAPFLALGRRYDEEGCDSMRMGAGVYSQIAREIRAAAKDAEL